MDIELKKSFENLSLNNKRDQLNAELLRINEYLKILSKVHNTNSVHELTNYLPESDFKMNEAQYLEMMYENMYYMELSVLDIINNVKK